jgi:N-acetylmuramoyl-L-alanine amidase
MINRRDLFRGAAAAAVTGAAALASTTNAQAAVRPTLRIGSRGSHVTYLQRKLRAAGYWCRSTDGYYDQTTQQAVMAVQKVHGLGRDGICGPATWARVAVLARPRARTTSGNIIEISKARQVIYVVVSGRVRWVFNTSTGASSTPTPSGRWRIERQIDGMRKAPLGNLWRPKYFYRGYAIHGSTSIPGYPASHGCARVSNTAMNYIWSAGLAPIGRRVWVY